MTNTIQQKIRCTVKMSLHIPFGFNFITNKTYMNILHEIGLY